MSTTLRKRGTLTRFLLAMAIATVATAGGASAASYTWNNGAGGNWSVGGNWLPAGPPATTADTVAFGAVGTGATNTMNIAALAIDSFTVNQGAHTTAMAGNTLTVDDLTVVNSGSATAGSLSLTGTGGLNADDSLRVGIGTDATASMSLAAGVALKVGVDASNRAAMAVGNNTGANPSANTSSLTAGSTFNAYLSSLLVGQRTSGYTAGITQGLLDLSAVTNPGVLDVAGDFKIGSDRQASGTVTVSDAVDVKIGVDASNRGLLYVSQSNHDTSTPASDLTLGTGRLDAYLTRLWVGEGMLANGTLDASNASGGVLDVSQSVRIGDYLNNTVDGRVTVSDNVDVKIGVDAANRAELTIGRAKGTSAGVSGILTAGRGEFTAYVDGLIVGLSNGYGNLDAQLNLGNVSVGLLDVAGNVQVGFGRMAKGAVTLSDNFVTKIGDPASRVTMGIGDGGRAGSSSFTAGGAFNAYLSELAVGRNTSTASNTQNSTLNLVDVDSGVVNVDGAVVVGQGPGATGSIMLSSLAPLVLSGSSTLAVGTGSLIDILFDAPIDPGIYYGLSWDGSHTTELANLLAAGKLTWDDTAVTTAGYDAVSIFEDTGVTYVGTVVEEAFIPEPATLLLVAAAGPMLIRRRRR